MDSFASVQASGLPCQRMTSPDGGFSGSPSIGSTAKSSWSMAASSCSSLGVVPAPWRGAPDRRVSARVERAAAIVGGNLLFFELRDLLVRPDSGHAVEMLRAQRPDLHPLLLDARHADRDQPLALAVLGLELELDVA